MSEARVNGLRAGIDWNTQALLCRTQLCELSSEVVRPAALPQGMDLHPHVAPPLVQLNGPGTTWNPKMPMPTARASRKFPLARHYEAALSTLRKRLLRGQCQVEFEDGASILEVMSVRPLGLRGRSHRRTVA